MTVAWPKVGQICDNDDNEHPLPFARASQNVAATAILLKGMPEPSTLERQQAYGELCILLKRAAIQQAESSVSQ
jgi:hypothetical protein